MASFCHLHTQATLLYHAHLDYVKRMQQVQKKVSRTKGGIRDAKNGLKQVVTYAIIIVYVSKIPVPHLLLVHCICYILNVYLAQSPSVKLMINVAMKLVGQQVAHQSELRMK